MKRQVAYYTLYWFFSVFCKIIMLYFHVIFNIVSQVSLERERQHDQTHVQNQLEKLDLLEQEYNKLTTMQALAEVSENFFLTST